MIFGLSGTNATVRSYDFSDLTVEKVCDENDHVVVELVLQLESSFPRFHFTVAGNA